MLFYPDGSVSSAVFSPDGKPILTVGVDSTARLWEASTGKQIGLAMKHGERIGYSPVRKSMENKFVFSTTTTNCNPH